VSNYVGINGCAGRGTDPVYGQYEGIYSNRSKNKTGNISDGSSNTLAFGENSSTRASWINSGTTDGAVTYNWIGGGTNGTIRGLKNGQQQDYRTLSSFHTGIVMFALGDGSVKALKVADTSTGPPTPSQSWYILQQLAGMRDGFTADTSSVLN